LANLRLLGERWKNLKFQNFKFLGLKFQAKSGNFPSLEHGTNLLNL
jgi:hypothetical protein